MRLMMLGYYGFGNAGDEAVLAAEMEALSGAVGAATSGGRSPQAGDNVEFVVVTGDVDHTRRIHGVEGVSRTDLRGIARALRGCDGLVAGGGSLLQDVTSARPVSFYGGVMLLARRLGKPVFAYAQGLGPLRRRANRALAGRALRGATYVSLRDLDSVRLAESMRVTGLDVVPDPVLGLSPPGSGADSGAGGPASEPASGAGPASGPASDSSGALAVALRPWGDQQAWLGPVVDALRALGPEVPIRCVPFHGGQDLQLAREVADRVGPRASVVEPDGGYRAALSAVAESRAVLGMRLHALIAAAGAGRPFVALSYDPKVTSFAGGIGQPVAATLPGPVQRDDLLSALQEALSGEAPLDPALVAELRTEARRPAVRIAALLAD